MKHLISLLLLCTTQAFAAPFLDCSPVPKGPAQPTIYQVSIPVSGEEVVIWVPATIDANGSAKLHCDLASFGLSLNTSYVAQIGAFNGPDPQNTGIFFSYSAVAFILTDATHAVITELKPIPPEKSTYLA